MKLYNRTAISDAVLAPVLTAAGRAVGARTGGVIVKVSSARSRAESLPQTQCQGTAYDYYAVGRWALSTRRHTKDGKIRRGRVRTDGGMIRLVIPQPRHCDPLALAQNIYETAAHEWSHIRDNQLGTADYDDQRERRKHHDNRSWERRAYAAASRAVKRQGTAAQDAVLALALALERIKEE